MPCETWGYPEKDWQHEADKLTRLLCGACTHITNWKAWKGASPELVAWWKKHQIEDAKRLAAEAAQRERQAKIKKARNKLTKEEQTLLGLRHG